MSGGNPLAGWVPLFVRGARGEVEWAYMGGERYTEPFCHQTMQRLASRPFNKLFRRRSGFELLPHQAAHHPGLPLKGIVFHMSRCGSTLAAQWLAALPDSVVLSEPEQVGMLIRWLPPDDNEAVLHGLLSAMGQPRRESDSSLFLKADCMHMIHIERFLTAFPGVPWVFLYRDPVEVLVSQRRDPSWVTMMESMPPPQGAPVPAELGNDPEGLTTWMLSALLQAAGQAATQHPNGLLLNYSEMPQALERIGAHFGIDPAAGGAAMQAVSGRDSKVDGKFRPDSDEKRAAADDRIRDLATRWLEEPYLALEQLRTRRGAD